MCVILHREPNQLIPYEQIEAACTRNQDGFGIVVLDRGKLEVVKEFDPNGNDPTKLMDYLDDAREHKVWVHLRYKTQGLESLANTHPFRIMSIADHGADMFFMHNGTLYGWGNNDVSDSNEFAEAVVAPLVQSFSYTKGSMHVLNYKPLELILGEFAGTNSIFSLFDSHGNELIINKRRGVKFPWGWASNSYSLEPLQKKALPPPPPTRTFSPTPTTPKTVPSITPITPKGNEFLLDEKNKGFFEEYSCNMNDVFKLDKESIEELVTDHPDTAVSLIVQLIYEHYMNAKDDDADSI